MTEQDTFIHDNYEFWHELIWRKLEDWNGGLKLKFTRNVGTFNTAKSYWSGLNTMNFIEWQNADSYGNGKVYVPEMNEWVSHIELLESITIPRKVE